MDILPTKLDLDPWKSNFRVGVVTENVIGKSRCIYYKEVPLWRTIAPTLDGVNFLVLGGDEEGEHYSLYCRDKEYGDYYSYGDWKTLEEVKAWLDAPVSLYF